MDLGIQAFDCLGCTHNNAYLAFCGTNQNELKLTA